jgi:serine/threonine protein kinase
MSDDQPQSAPTFLGPGVGVAPGGDLPPGFTVGEYRIDNVLGRGGMGTVYGATQPVIEKRVAIKVLNGQFSADPGLVRRFIDEARAVNRIRHANIIDIFSFGQIGDGRQYFVMEYLEGTTLGARMEKGDLGNEDMPGLLAQICDALDAAHGENIVHRDLKPENVWIVTPKRGNPFIKLLDFGIAKLLSTGERSVTQTGMVMGTPHYMSPEQCHGKAVDHRTDIYAMGVMLYQLYSGRLPFQGESFAEILAKQIIDTPERPSKYGSLPPELDKLIMRCLSKDPAGRPQTAKELGQTLTSIFAGAAARVARAAGQPTSATTLSASAVELRRRLTEVSSRPAGRRMAVIGVTVGVFAAIAIAVAALSGRGHAPALVSPPSQAAAQPVAAPPVARAAVTPPVTAPVVPVVPAVPPIGAPPAAAVLDAAGGKKRRPGAKLGRLPDEPASPGRPARSRASDTGLVTHNPFE